MTEAAAPQESVSEAPQESQGNSFQIPEAYQDRGWAKTIDSEETLWKTLDNTQSLIGKKQVPSADASDEEWSNFYKQLGRPEAPDGYELREQFDGLPEGVDIAESKQKAAELAHKIGLTPKQAEQLWDGYMSMELEAMQESQKARETQEADLDKKFDELGNSIFGDSFNDVSEQAQKYLADVLPEELKGVPEQLQDNPEALLAMIKLANHSQIEIQNVKKQYGAEDNLQSGQQSKGVTAQDVNKQLIEAKAAYSKSPVFSQERKDAEEKINQLREQLKTLAK